jgi:hypothetical protein
MYHRNYAIRLATLLGHISQRLDDNKLETMCSEEAKAWFKRIPHNSVARKPRNISEYSLWRPELDPDNPVRRHYLKPVVQFWVTSDELERWTNDNRRDLTRLLYPCVFEFHVPPVRKITFNRHDLAPADILQLRKCIRASIRLLRHTSRLVITAIPKTRLFF